MTRPIELKPREDEVAGTPPAGYTVGQLPQMEFTVTPEIVKEYIEAIDGDPSPYVVDDRPVAPPNVLGVYLLATIYRKYPPIQGIILTDITWRFRHPIWADEDTSITVQGRVDEIWQRRGKHFVRWSACFTRNDGEILAEARNTMYVPAQRHEER